MNKVRWALRHFDKPILAVEVNGVFQDSIGIQQHLFNGVAQQNAGQIASFYSDTISTLVGINRHFTELVNSFPFCKQRCPPLHLGFYHKDVAARN